MLKPANTDIYEFGEFRLDAGNQLLWRGEQQVKLSLKEFEVLFFLVDNAGRVVGKTELHEAIWKDTFIEEGTLTQNISRLRKKIEASTTDADGEIIETIPKRGYRFLPAVKRRRILKPVAILTAEEYVPAVSSEQKSSLSDDALKTNSQEPLRADSSDLAEKTKAETKRSKLLWIAIAGTVMLFVVVAAFFFWKSFAPATTKSLVAKNIIPFSGATGREDNPAFSPDGKQLVYSWNGDENMQRDIYVRLTEGGDPVRLTETDFNEQYPIFSPDGLKVAFVRNLGTYGEVYLIPALGGTERRICRLFSGNYSISFAPDGKSLAVVDTEDSTDKKQYAIYLVDIETGKRRRLTNPGEFLGETTPRFAPDGRSIAFVRVFDEQRQDLFTVPVNSSENAAPAEPKRITSDQKIIHSLAWSPDGKTLFFVSLRGTNRAGMWRVPVNGSQEPESVLTGSRDITNLAISPDNKTIAFVENEIPDMDIWQATSGETKPQKFLAATFNDFNPSLAPDDSHLIFTSNRSGKTEVWEADLTGKNLRQLTKTEVSIGRAAMSPDGKRVAFEAKYNFATGIFITDLESGANRELIAPDGSSNAFPTWSADGHWVYFTSNRTGSDQIWKVSADETGGNNNPVQITTQSGYRAFPAPDGTLYFNKSRDNADFWGIQNQSESNETEHPIADPAVLNSASRWTATRAGIYFLFENSDGFYNVKFYDFVTHQVTATQTKFWFPSQVFSSLAITSDGKNLLFATNTANSSHIIFASLEQ